jgi:hypothetical protein
MRRTGTVDVRMPSNTLSQIVIGLASLSSKQEGGLLANGHRPLSRITMQIAWEAESGLAEIDERIADADRNISQISRLIPELEIKGYPTTNVERDLALMRTALHHLRAQRRTIVETLDEDEPLPRIARTTAHSQHHRTSLAAPTVAQTENVSIWHGFYTRLRAS